MFQRNTEPGQSRLATPSWAPPSAAGQGGSLTCGPWDDLPRPCGVQLIRRPSHGLASRSDVMVTATRWVLKARSCRIGGVPGLHKHPRLCIAERWACASDGHLGLSPKRAPRIGLTRVRSRHNTAVSLRWRQLGVSRMRLLRGDLHRARVTGRPLARTAPNLRCSRMGVGYRARPRVFPAGRLRAGGPVTVDLRVGPRRGSSLGSAVSDGRAYSCGVVGGTFPGVEVSAAGRLGP